MLELPTTGYTLCVLSRNPLFDSISDSVFMSSKIYNSSNDAVCVILGILLRPPVVIYTISIYNRRSSPNRGSSLEKVVSDGEGYQGRLESYSIKKDSPSFPRILPA